MPGVRGAGDAARYGRSAKALIPDLADADPPYGSVLNNCAVLCDAARVGESRGWP